MSRTPRIRRLFQHDLYCADLAWYYCELASLSGEKSAAGGQLAIISGYAVGGDYCSESNWYTDQQTGWPGRERRPDGTYGGTQCHFRRGRRIWATIKRLPWQHQQLLSEWYEPRQYWPKERDRPSDSSVKAAHMAYYEARIALL
jgi:hypothetical protein